MRTGLIFKKLGMTRIFTEEGDHIPVTLLQAQDCQVVGHKTLSKDGYCALQLGLGEAKVKRLSKALRGHFSKAGVAPKQRLMEFRVGEDALLDVGALLSVSHFKEGQFVDVSSVSIGKGFAGVMKRYNFGGSRATHGVSLSHRSHGSTGQRQDPGKVFKGKKMAGHMGARRVTTQNLKVVLLDPDQQIIALKGAVPGAKGSFIRVCDAVKKKGQDLPFPGALVEQKTEA